MHAPQVTRRGTLLHFLMPSTDGWQQQFNGLKKFNPKEFRFYQKE